VRALAWSIRKRRGNEAVQMQDEQLAGVPVAGPMEQIQDKTLTGTPAAELMAQIRDE
jgi:hypothetical protein